MKKAWLFLEDLPKTVMLSSSFSGRSLTILKNGIYKYLNNKLVKQSNLLGLFSVLYHQVETKISSSPNYFLFLKFGNNTEFRLKLLCWSTAMWKKNQHYCKKGDFFIYILTEEMPLHCKYHSTKMYCNFIAFLLTYNFCQWKWEFYTQCKGNEWSLNFL